jgi:hypothetical protein
MERAMRAFVRFVGGCSVPVGCLLTIAGLTAAYFLPEKLAEYSKEPEDVYGLGLLFLLTFPLGLLTVWSGLGLVRTRPLARWESNTIPCIFLAYFIVFTGITIALIALKTPDARPDEWLTLPMPIVIGLILLAFRAKKRMSAVAPPPGLSHSSTPPRPSAGAPA